MTDRGGALIRIGGPVRDIDGFIDVVNRDGPTIEWDSADYVTRDDLDAAARNGEPLELVHSQATVGTFPRVEEWCRANGLTYVRESQALYEASACVEWWQPGMDKPDDCLANQWGDTCVFVALLRKVLREGPNDAEIVQSIADIVENCTPPKVPALELVD